MGAGTENLLGMLAEYNNKTNENSLFVSQLTTDCLKLVNVVATKKQENEALKKEIEELKKQVKEPSGDK